MRALDLAGVAHADRAQLDAQRRRRGLNGGELAGPGGCAGFAKDRRSFHAGRDLLEQLQLFPARAVLEQGKSGHVAARPCQALDIAGADGVGDQTNTIGTVRVACCNATTEWSPLARMTSGSSATSSAAY